MDESAFWRIVEDARARAGDDRDDGEAVAEALVELLSAGPTARALRFGRRLERLHRALYRWDVWAAAYLVGEGCSDDAFVDFRAGVIAQGRQWYERVLASPDALADHPLVRRAAAAGDLAEGLFAEPVLWVVGQALERIGGPVVDDDGPGDGGDQVERDPFADPAGEAFAFDDDAEMRRRLPRLAALYLPA